MLRCMLISMFLVVFALYGCGDSGPATSSTDESDTSSTTETGTDAADEAVEEADTTEEAAEDVAATDVSAAPETTDDRTPEEDVLEEVEPEPAAGVICPEIFQCLRAACMEGATTTMAEEPAGAPRAPDFAAEEADATSDSDAVEEADAAAGPTEADVSTTVVTDAATETATDAEAAADDVSTGPVEADVLAEDDGGTEISEEMACYTAALAGCGPVFSDSENEAALKLVSCMVDLGCSFEDKPEHYECQRNCVEELASCWTPTNGDGECYEISACTEDCVDIFGNPDVSCTRDCLSEASAEDVVAYWDMKLCVLGECYGTGSEEQVEQCLLDELQNATCIEEYSQCYPPIGSAPGAGAGGSK